jgi:hypothetical protein
MEQAMFGTNFVREGGVCVGVCLGFASTSGHKGDSFSQVTNHFNIKSDQSDGLIQSVRVNNFERERLVLKRFEGVTYLVADVSVAMKQMLGGSITQKDLERHFPDKPLIVEEGAEGLLTSWGQGGFAIKTTTHPDLLAEMYSAFVKKDIAFFLSFNEKHKAKVPHIVVISKCSSGFLENLIQYPKR